MTRPLWQLVLLFAVALLAVPAAQADYYKYTDAKGSVNITNKLDSVPQKYRSRVQVVTDEALSKKDVGARKAQVDASQEEGSTAREEVAAPKAAEPEGKIAQLSAKYPWFKPLLYVAGILAAFLVVMKVASAVSSSQLSKLIYLSFFIGVFVLLYKAYVEHVVADSIAVKEKAVNMMQKSMVRELPLPGEAPAAGEAKPTAGK